MTKQEKVEYLRDLANRLWHVPVCYGTDQGDIDVLLALARELERDTHAGSLERSIAFQEAGMDDSYDRDDYGSGSDGW